MTHLESTTHPRIIQRQPMSNWLRLNFGLAVYVVLLSFMVTIVQTINVLFNGSVPTERLGLSVVICIFFLLLLGLLQVRWRLRHPILIWLLALLALPLFVSILVGVCPRCKWTTKQVQLGESDLAVTYKTTAYTGISQTGVMGEDGFWVPDMANNRVVLLSPETNQVIQEYKVGQNPVGIAIGFGSIWTSNFSDGTVTRLNIDGNIPSTTIAVGGVPLLLASSDEAVWVTDRERGIVSRINPQTNSVESTIYLGGNPVGIVAGPSTVWVARTLSNKVALIDPEANRAVRSLDTTSYPLNMALTANDLWIVSPTTGLVQRFDTKTLEKVAEIQVGGEPTGVAVDDQFAWVTRSTEKSLVRISVDDNTIVGDPLPTGELPKTVSSDGSGGVWIMEEGENKVSHIVLAHEAQPIMQESAVSWFNSWLATTLITTSGMVIFGTPLFLLAGLLTLALALTVLFRLEIRYGDNIPFWWKLALLLLFALLLAGFVLDISIAISTTVSCMIAFVVVIRLTSRIEPKPKIDQIDQEVGVMI